MATTSWLRMGFVLLLLGLVGCAAGGPSGDDDDDSAGDGDADTDSDADSDADSDSD